MPLKNTFFTNKWTFSLTCLLSDKTGPMNVLVVIYMPWRSINRWVFLQPILWPVFGRIACEMLKMHPVCIANARKRLFFTSKSISATVQCNAAYTWQWILNGTFNGNCMPLVTEAWFILIGKGAFQGCIFHISCTCGTIQRKRAFRCCWSAQKAFPHCGRLPGTVTMCWKWSIQGFHRLHDLSMLTRSVGSLTHGSMVILHFLLFCNA